MSIAERVARRVNERFQSERLKPFDLGRLFDEEIAREKLGEGKASSVRSEAASIAAKLRIERRRAS